MPWDMNDYPASMKNMDSLVRKKAIDIANALLEDGYDEDRAIPIAQSQAKEWHQDASDEEKRAFEKEAVPTKHDEHESSSNEDLIDNDVEVFFEEDVWKVQTKGAERPAQTFDKKTDAVKRAKEMAANKESKVIIYKKDGSKQKEQTPD
ncbi:DUF2188 domain-containing protein [Atopococcus tabaci]|uniref:DUF2188 domain-containing protein n=1 Tax=Atopococcus tabaci TaxID=269774 RepID=UPI0024097C01|nr:DUF2188 domain-containing protein [Atopococcus tabaci]